MSSPSILVLKFGGSVLVDEDSFARAIHEIARWRREGLRVVAVCSALSGETARRSASCPAELSPHGRASYLAGGERAAAQSLGQTLERAGIEARVASPTDLNLRATGSALDATPTSVDVARLRRELDEVPVIVVPGFFAEGEDGDTVLLGLGGSDSTALFLAHALGGVRCRLIKDVPALFEDDPKRPGPRPRRYERASYGDALGTDGSIVQHQAVQFAQEKSLRFEIAELQGIGCTEVGAAPSVFSSEPQPQAQLQALRPLKVALLGLGTVGGGVAQRLLADPARFELTRVLVRSTKTPRDGSVPRERLTEYPEEILRDSPDLVIELLGGLDPAGRLIELALEHGTSVVSANKQLLAERGSSLGALAERTGAYLLASASVGGALPVLEQVLRLKSKEVRCIRGVLNGTANFVLESLAAGLSLEASVERAQELGLAEANVDRDLGGWDALDKLHVLAQALGWTLPRGTVPSVGLPEPGAERLFQVAQLERGRASVQHVPLVKTDPLSEVRGAGNRVILDLTDGTSFVLGGLGAGRLPTTESVMGDVFEIWRSLQSRQQEACHAL